MPLFQPFAGLRYGPAIPLDKVIAPPYDVVGPEERARLADRHRANAIHVELPAEDPRAGLDRYAHAAHLFASWRGQGVVQPDPLPAFYAYRMTSPDGTSVAGVIGALGCEPPGGDVLPHEQTIPKDTTDRLDLLRACRANLSPIWGLSLTPGLAEAYRPEGEPEARAVDDGGVLHSLWVLDDPAAIDEVARRVAASPVVIADGHHRYETALRYQAERRAATGGSPGEFDLVMAFIVELAEDQLSVGPIHRAVAGVPSDLDLVESFQLWFDTVHAGPTEDHVLEAVAVSGAMALVVPGGVWLLTPREEAYEAAGSDLDSSLVALVTDKIGGVQLTYRHDWRTAVGALTSDGAQAALLLRPVTVRQIRNWAESRRRMPPKSTYFRPKPRTGMVFRPVEG
jgi:uncharacterized protein (DUF1015 family)